MANDIMGISIDPFSYDINPDFTLTSQDKTQFFGKLSNFV